MAISILLINGELRAEANACQLGCELSFICSHAVTIPVRHLRASPRWLVSISLSVSGNSPSATPRLNQSAVKVDMLSKIVLKESFTEGLEIVMDTIHNIEIVMDNTQHRDCNGQHTA